MGHQCAYCGAVFSTEDDLDSHIIEEAELAEKGAHADFVGEPEWEEGK